MSQSYTLLHYHVVFGTKRREPSIVSRLREPLYRYLGSLSHHRRANLVACGGIADHVHMLVRLRPDTAVSAFVRAIKATSSRWINKEQLTPSRFAWQSGFSAFTVSQSSVAAVSRYINNQPEHHRRQTYAEELNELLTRHGLAHTDSRKPIP